MLFEYDGARRVICRLEYVNLSILEKEIFVFRSGGDEEKFLASLTPKEKETLKLEDEYAEQIKANLARQEMTGNLYE